MLAGTSTSATVGKVRRRGQSHDQGQLWVFKNPEFCTEMGRAERSRETKADKKGPSQPKSETNKWLASTGAGSYYF